MLNKINQLEQKINNGKKLIANAITDKGVTTPVDSTLETMANNINSITGGGGLEPGSMIPSSMLEPPQETTIATGGSTNKIVNCETDDFIIHNIGSYEPCYKFDKLTKQTKKMHLNNKYEFAIIKKFEDKIVFFSAGSNGQVIITDLQLNILNTPYDTGVSAGSSYVYNMCEIDNYYVITIGSYSVSYEHVIRIDKTTYEVTVKKLSEISTTSKSYHLGLHPYRNHIYLFGNNDSICLNENLEQVGISTNIKINRTNSNENFNVFDNDGYIYVLEYSSSAVTHKIKKVTPETLEVEEIQYDPGRTKAYDKIVYVSDKYVYIHSKIDTLRIYNKKLEFQRFVYAGTSKMENVIWLQEIDNYLIVQNNDSIVLIDMDRDFETIFNIAYNTAIATVNNFQNSQLSFNDNHKIAYIIDDKIYLFRTNASYIDLEPKYTIKARALAELPVVMSYIAKRLKNPCTKEDCEDHK